MTHGFASGFTDRGERTLDNLIAGELYRVTLYVTVTGDVALKRGTVMGRITDDQRYQLSDAAATDGSEKPSAILAEDIDPTQGDVEAVVYLTGEFNQLALLIGPGHTIDSLKSAFRTFNIFLRTNVPIKAT